MSKIPSLEELLIRLSSDVKFKESSRELYRRIAAGERHPTEPPLPGNVIVLASQAMVVLFNHVDSLQAQASADDPDDDWTYEDGVLQR